MTTRQELENLLQGRDAIANAVIDHLLANGWESDRILKNLATKRYPPHSAAIRVTFDSEYRQYWVKGEYVSKGENVLGTCFACIEATSSKDEIASAVDAFLRAAEACIKQSFAVRFLGYGAMHSFADVRALLSLASSRQDLIDLNDAVEQRYWADKQLLSMTDADWVEYTTLLAQKESQL